jgi:hypothetical protein
MRPPGRLSAPARELGGGQPQAEQAAGDQADQRPGLVPGLLDGDQQADEGAERRRQVASVALAGIMRSGSTSGWQTIPWPVGRLTR